MCLLAKRFFCQSALCSVLSKLHNCVHHQFIIHQTVRYDWCSANYPAGRLLCVSRSTSVLEELIVLSIHLCSDSQIEIHLQPALPSETCESIGGRVPTFILIEGVPGDIGWRVSAKYRISCPLVWGLKLRSDIL